jgi:hypothetical protein
MTRLAPIQFRLPPHLQAALEETAGLNGVSANEWAKWLVITGLGLCFDCTESIDLEDFMVHDEIWAAAGMDRGYLCVGCLEARLGRELTRADFTDVPVNQPDREWMSERLYQRLTGAKKRVSKKPATRIPRGWPP